MKPKRNKINIKYLHESATFQVNNVNLSLNAQLKLIAERLGDPFNSL